MLVVPSDAVLGTQPLDEIEIAFTVLGAVFAFRAGVDIEDVDIRLDTRCWKMRWLKLNCR